MAIKSDSKIWGKLFTPGVPLKAYTQCFASEGWSCELTDIFPLNARRFQCKNFDTQEIFFGQGLLLGQAP